MSDESAERQEEYVDPLSLFPEEIRIPVEGLAYLGRLTETLHFCGHTFDIQTLLPHHKLAISLALQPYRGTIHEVNAYEWIHVGMAVTAVDGNQHYCPPIGPDLEDLARARLSYVSQKWYPPTLAFLWSRYVLLEATATKAIDEIDRLSQRGQPMNLPPWLDSLKDLGHLADETPSDTSPFTPSKSDSSS